MLRIVAVHSAKGGLDLDPLKLVFAIETGLELFYVLSVFPNIKKTGKILEIVQA